MKSTTPWFELGYGGQMSAMVIFGDMTVSGDETNAEHASRINVSINVTTILLV